MHFGATFWIEYMRVRLEPLWVYDGRLSNNIRRFGATYEHFGILSFWGISGSL